MHKYEGKTMLRCKWAEYMRVTVHDSFPNSWLHLFQTM